MTNKNTTPVPEEIDFDALAAELDLLGGEHASHEEQIEWLRAFISLAMQAERAKERACLERIEKEQQKMKEDVGLEYEDCVLLSAVRSAFDELLK